MSRALTSPNRFHQVPAEVPAKSPRAGKAKPRLVKPRSQCREPHWEPNMYKSTYGRAYFFERQVNKRRVYVALGRDLRAARNRAYQLNQRIDRGEPVELLKNSRATVAEFFDDALAGVR